MKDIDLGLRSFGERGSLMKMQPKILLRAIFLSVMLVIAFSYIPLSAHITHAMPVKTIDVNLSQQRLVAYQGGTQVYSTLVMTGRPGLGTPIGTYHVFAKLSPTTFHSPWAPGSPNWYPPTHINYALEWKAGGYFLHDSWWHTRYGPGTTGWHYDPTYGWQSGSHGCVSMPLGAAAWLYRWAPIGTAVTIHY
jgi:lipoprotein-anchoring transpeptidase ErfK/SrfK